MISFDLLVLVHFNGTSTQEAFQSYVSRGSDRKDRLFFQAMQSSTRLAYQCLS